MGSCLPVWVVPFRLALFLTCCIRFWDAKRLVDHLPMITRAGSPIRPLNNSGIWAWAKLIPPEKRIIEMWPIDLSEARVRNFVGRNSSKITGVLRRAMRDGLRRYRMARSGVPLIVTPVGL